MKYWFVCLLVVTACSRSQPLPVYGLVPDFELTAQTGRQFSRRDLLGKIWVADFVYTTCTGPCPLMTRNLRRVQTAKPEILLVSFSVDPEHDTPAALQAYAQTFHAGPQWFFLTGDRNTLQTLSRDAFKLADLGLIHSTRFVLVDRQSQIRGYYTEIPELLAGIRNLER